MFIHCWLRGFFGLCLSLVHLFIHSVMRLSIYPALHPVGRYEGPPILPESNPCMRSTCAEASVRHTDTM